jgi:hypothetical protein
VFSPIYTDLHARCILGPKRVPQIAVDADSLDIVYNTTVLTNLSSPSKPPLYLDICQTTNDQWDFLKFVVYLLETNKLKKGEVLVLDNAKVHDSMTTIQILIDLLCAAGVLLCFMLNYCPEVNPTEQVHNHVKGDIHLNHSEPCLWQSILTGHATITHDLMISWYNMCVGF